MKYEILTISNFPVIQQVIRLTDNNITLFIPIDEANTDYQEYLAWLAEGNEPEVING